MEINTSINKNTMTLFCIFGILLSLITTYVALKPIVDINVLKISTKTEAIITANTTVTGSTRVDRGYAIKFDYIVNGLTLKGKDAPYWKIIKYNEGDSVDVYYSNNKPSSVKIYHLSYGLLSFSIFLSSGLVIILNKNLKRV